MNLTFGINPRVFILKFIVALLYHIRIPFYYNYNQNSYIFIQEYAFENAMFKMVTIVFFNALNV